MQQASLSFAEVFMLFEMLDLSVAQLRCCESVWEFSSRDQHFCLVFGCRKKIFAAVSFLSFVTNQTRLVILILQTKPHLLIWVNNFWFWWMCLYEEMDRVAAGNCSKLGKQKEACFVLLLQKSKSLHGCMFLHERLLRTVLFKGLCFCGFTLLFIWRSKWCISLLRFLMFELRKWYYCLRNCSSKSWFKITWNEPEISMFFLGLNLPFTHSIMVIEWGSLLFFCLKKLAFESLTLQRGKILE